MEKLEFSNLNECAYLERLDNGLTVCVIPSSRTKRFFAMLGTRYGALDAEFMLPNTKEFYKTHTGVAHFLEHKVFEMKDGLDPFTYFAKSGCGANASTSYECTKYYIWGVNRPYQNINYLLKFVYSPYFTDENISKEQGIIGEEIKMYDDDAGWLLDDLGRKALFNTFPVDSISGTIDSIKNITKDELYTCFNYFYVPNNMILVVGGNVSPSKIISLVKKNSALNKIKPNYKIIRKEYNEPLMVNSEFMESKSNVFIPKLKYLFKIDLEKFSIKDRVKVLMYINIISSILFGQGSAFYEIVHDNNYANDYFINHSFYRNFYTMEFEAESDKGDLFKDTVDKTLDLMHIQDDEFMRTKKVWIASEIRISDNVDLIVDATFDDLLIYNKVINKRIDIIRSLNMKELEQVIKELDLSNRSFILVNPES